jgi:hypothetical protein
MFSLAEELLSSQGFCSMEIDTKKITVILSPSGLAEWVNIVKNTSRKKKFVRMTFAACPLTA